MQSRQDEAGVKTNSISLRADLKNMNFLNIWAWWGEQRNKQRKQMERGRMRIEDETREKEGVLSRPIIYATNVPGDTNDQFIVAYQGESNYSVKYL